MRHSTTFLLAAAINALPACSRTTPVPTDAVVISVVQDQPAPSCPRFGWRSFVQTGDGRVFELCGVKESVGTPVRGVIEFGSANSALTPRPEQFYPCAQRPGLCQAAGGAP